MRRREDGRRCEESFSLGVFDLFLIGFVSIPEVFQGVLGRFRAASGLIAIAY